jgi:hypothetical protein
LISFLLLSYRSTSTLAPKLSSSHYMHIEKMQI